MGRAVDGSMMVFCEQQGCEVIELNVPVDPVHFVGEDSAEDFSVEVGGCVKGSLSDSGF